MHVDMMVNAGPLRDVQRLAADAADAGFSGLVVTEAARTAYLSCAAAALTADLDLATGIAVAFPRSPMVTAQVAWELAQLTGGRFRLGLGTQVRAHIERRYGAQFDHPGPRMREYVEAVRSCFRAFRGEALDHHGEFYDLSLLPAFWAPGPIGVADPPIDVAAVNPWMLEMAGEVADGVHVHPLNNPIYLRETVLPRLAAGAARAGRDPAGLQVIVPAFTALGESAAEQQRWREVARTQVAFYGSTPGYGGLFDQLGHSGTTDRIRERQKARDIPGMAAAVPDELLDHFVVVGDVDDVTAQLRERYEGVATRVVLYFAGLAWQRDPAALGPFGAVARALRGQ
ncbi:MAG: TIGR03617 family F420-dependent LLM class oxidoreductase [Mycobacteriales bacterium]